MKWSLIWDGLGALANLAATALAAFSIKITIHEQQQIRTDEKNKSIISQQMLWYNEIVLQDIIRELNVFIEHSNKIILDLYNHKTPDDKNYENMYTDICEEYQIISERLFILKIFDYSLFWNCKKPLEAVLDNYYNIIETLETKHYISRTEQSQIQKNKVEFITILYNYGKSSYTTTQ